MFGSSGGPSRLLVARSFYPRVHSVGIDVDPSVGPRLDRLEVVVRQDSIDARLRAAYVGFGQIDFGGHTPGVIIGPPQVWALPDPAPLKRGHRVKRATIQEVGALRYGHARKVAVVFGVEVSAISLPYAKPAHIP